MPKKQKPQKKQDTKSAPMTGRNWEQWRDTDDHTGDNLVKGKYETPQDYFGSDEYYTHQPTMHANRIEQALIFMRKLVEQHGLKLKSDGIIGEKIVIVLDGQGSPDRKIEATLLKEYKAAGYGTIRIDISWK